LTAQVYAWSENDDEPIQESETNNEPESTDDDDENDEAPSRSRKTVSFKAIMVLQKMFYNNKFG